MEKFNKKISLEPYTTRFPLCYPSLKDGELCYFDPNNYDINETSNYGKLPLGINEYTLDVCSDGSITTYSDFTPEMGAYSGSVLSFAVLQRWFTQMLEYRKKLYSDECHGKFENMADYYQRKFGVTENPEAIEMDELYIKHGGDNFYNWLIKNYFILFDLENEYDINTIIRDRFSYFEWLDVLKNIGTSKLYYPEVLDLYAKMKKWHELYNDNTDCSTVDKCCDCVDYKLCGGDTMVELLAIWIDETNERIIGNNEALSGLGETIEELYPTIDISVLLKSRMEDLGVYVPFAKEFNPEIDYTSGNVCTYKDEVWLKTDISRRGTPPDTWVTYSEYYYSLPEHSGETIERFEGLTYNGIITGYSATRLITMPDMSGRTSSSLDSFLRTEDTVDGMGNTLPGHFRPFGGSTVPQPAEGSMLDLSYQPGAYANTTILVDNGKASNNVYFGDVLAYIEVFCKDGSGKLIEDTKNTIYPNDNSLEKINETISAVTVWNEEAIETVGEDIKLPSDGKIYADFTYYKGAIFTLGNGMNFNVSGDTHLICTDHCILNEKVCSYALSSTENYPLRYYSIVMDRETHYSVDQHKDVDVFMCDFIFKPSEFPSGYTINDSVVAPNLRREEMLPFSMLENPVDNIYIDRGYATVLDRHLRICEISRYEQLEKYGNGIFQIYDAGSGDV